MNEAKWLALQTGMNDEVGGGWLFVRWFATTPGVVNGVAMGNGRLRLYAIVSEDVIDEVTWLHGSLSGADRVPSFAELKGMKMAIWGPDGEAYQVFPGVENYVNLHENCLHLWGRSDGKPALPDFQ